MIMSIYEARQFSVRDSGYTSDRASQYNGILQGCPLSPFLFSILMSVLILDAKDDLEMKYGIELSSQIGMHELLYADDTLLIDIHGISLQKYMDCIADQGLAYGMQFNWDKLEILAVNASVEILSKNNVPIKYKSSIQYLGSILSADGHFSSELSRRIGMASQDFKNLSKCWSHIRIAKWV